MSAQEHHLKKGGGDLSMESSSALVVPSSESLDAFKALKIRRTYNALIYRIDNDTSSLQLESSFKSTSTTCVSQEALSALPDTECRYAVLDVSLTTADGRPTSKLWFVTWCPLNAAPPSKMAYTHAKGALRSHFTGCFDLNADSKSSLLSGLGNNITSGDDGDNDSNSEFEDD